MAVNADTFDVEDGDAANEPGFKVPIPTQPDVKSPPINIVQFASVLLVIPYVDDLYIANLF